MVFKERDELTAFAASLALHALIGVAFVALFHSVAPEKGEELFEVTLVTEAELAPKPVMESSSTPPAPEIKQEAPAPKKFTAVKKPKPLAELALYKAKQEEAAPQPASLPSAAKVEATPAPQAPDTYAAELLKWLNKYKTYPASARARRVEGRGVLYLNVAADGAILNANLAQSTGDEALDAAVMSMTSRASPVPAPPGGARSFRLPIQFRLKAGE